MVHISLMSRKLIAILILFFSIPAALAVDATKDDLIYRVNLGRADDVKLLLKQGNLSANEKDAAGTPLFLLAARRRDSEGIEVMQVLLDAGADINVKDNEGRN